MFSRLWFCLLFVALSGCAQTSVDLIPIGLAEGVVIGFPATEVSRVEGEDIRFYSKDRFLGYVQRDALPKDEQPAVDFVKRGLELSKRKNWKLKEISRKGFVGYVVYVENTATLHLAAEQDPETVFTISTADPAYIDQIVATLATSQ